jgi:hypothetical protein
MTRIDLYLFYVTYFLCRIIGDFEILPSGVSAATQQMLCVYKTVVMTSVFLNGRNLLSQLSPKHLSDVSQRNTPMCNLLPFHSYEETQVPSNLKPSGNYMHHLL